jgi:hypothetical protein
VGIGSRIARLESLAGPDRRRPCAVAVPEDAPPVALYGDGTRRTLTEAELAELLDGPGPLKVYRLDPSPMWQQGQGGGRRAGGAAP